MSSRLEAQHHISGSISSENKEALAGATFILSLRIRFSAVP